MPSILIVAYGNPLRCDDGVAWRAADELESRLPESEVQILRQHQLAPEVADAVRDCKLVVFLDAACLDESADSHPGQICAREISGSALETPSADQFSHVYSPEKVLNLARQLYQASPKAIVITVTGEDFGHGDGLSRPLTAALPAVVANIEQIVRPHLSDS